MKKNKKNRLISGVQPSSRSLHLGNFLGTVRKWSNLQNKFESLFFIPNLHAITNLKQVKLSSIKQNAYAIASQYIASGVNPEKSIIFNQSHVLEHTQLAWILSCLTNFNEISNMSQFKKKINYYSKSNHEYNNKLTAGFYFYPILQAADILLYAAKEVPVGEDQRQHIELTRNIAKRFNRLYNTKLTIPRAYISKTIGKIYDLQNPITKMSKSNVNHNGVIFISDSSDEIKRKIRIAITDSDNHIIYNPVKKPGISNLMNIYSEITGLNLHNIENNYVNKRYFQFKSDLIDRLVSLIIPIQRKSEEILENFDYLNNILIEGSYSAKSIAKKTISSIYNKLGI